MSPMPAAPQGPYGTVRRPARRSHSNEVTMKAILAGAAIAAVVSGAALAAPVIARDGRFEADVSARQMSRISIVGEKIASVRKLDEPGGPQLIVETDEASGDAFIAFDGDVAGRAFSAFLTTESGKVVQAVLRPAPGEAQTVLVRLEGVPPGPPAAAARAETTPAGLSMPPVGANATGPSSPYQERLVQFVRLMFNDQDAEGVTRRVTGAAPMKAGPFTVRQVTAWDSAGLHGRVLYVTNIGKAEEVVRLEAFLVERVYAAATSHERLRPGEQGRVFIVEELR